MTAVVKKGGPVPPFGSNSLRPDEGVHNPVTGLCGLAWEGVGVCLPELLLGNWWQIGFFLPSHSGDLQTGSPPWVGHK